MTVLSRQVRVPSQRAVPTILRSPAGRGVAVLLGTDHHPFDRLVEWAATLAAGSPDPWFVQHGSSQLHPELDGRRMLGGRELTRLLGSVDVVVTHGGPGLIMEARAARHIPIVVPRDPALGEHVDGHQIRFAQRLDERGDIRLVNSLDQLREAVELAKVMGRIAADVPTQRAETTVRFGELVDQLHQRARRR